MKKHNPLRLLYRLFFYIGPGEIRRV